MPSLPCQSGNSSLDPPRNRNEPHDNRSDNHNRKQESDREGTFCDTTREAWLECNNTRNSRRNVWYSCEQHTLVVPTNKTGAREGRPRDRWYRHSNLVTRHSHQRHLQAIISGQRDGHESRILFAIFRRTSRFRKTNCRCCIEKQSDI